MKFKLTPVAVFSEVYVKDAGVDSWRVEQADSWNHDPGDGDLRRFGAAGAFIPDEDGWAELCRVATSAVPNVAVAIGASLVGNYPYGDVGAEHLPGTILIGLRHRLPGPLGLLHHEIMHAVWHRLDADSREVLEKHGAALRLRNRENVAAQGPFRFVHPVEWFDSPEEAEAVAFQEWAIGNSVCLDIEHPSEVEEVWARIRAGGFA